MADLSITAASVTPGTAVTPVIDKTRNFGATINAGQAVYLDTNNVWQLADADGAAALRQCNGISLNSGASGQPAAVQTAGSINIGATTAVGSIYILSNTAGGIAPSSDLASGWYTNIIGIARTNATIDIQLAFSNVAKP